MDDLRKRLEAEQASLRHAQLTLLFALFCVGVSAIFAGQGYLVAGWVAIALAVGACGWHWFYHRDRRR